SMYKTYFKTFLLLVAIASAIYIGTYSLHRYQYKTMIRENEQRRDSLVAELLGRPYFSLSERAVLRNAVIAAIRAGNSLSAGPSLNDAQQNSLLETAVNMFDAYYQDNVQAFLAFR